MKKSVSQIKQQNSILKYKNAQQPRGETPIISCGSTCTATKQLYVFRKELQSGGFNTQYLFNGLGETSADGQLLKAMQEVSRAKYLTFLAALAWIQHSQMGKEATAMCDRWRELDCQSDCSFWNLSWWRGAKVNHYRIRALRDAWPLCCCFRGGLWKVRICCVWVHSGWRGAGLPRAVCHRLLCCQHRAAASPEQERQPERLAVIHVSSPAVFSSLNSELLWWRCWSGPGSGAWALNTTHKTGW